MNKSEIEHIGISVEHLIEMANWYRDVLGFNIKFTAQDKEKGTCQGYDRIQESNDLFLCENCSDKLDRDIIRQRDWDYSSLAFGCPEEKLEDLRTDIIKHYGEKYDGKLFL